ncbi:MAG TPA: hypothetical protein VFX37_06830 [Pseudolabrys sp.]|nr:hypothetical protein [Pseudolabrys sp.]
MKIFLTTVALAALAASPAFAASHKRAANVEASSAAAYTSFAAVPGQDVVTDDQIVGRDPDANVRLQLLRDADSYAY